QAAHKVFLPLPHNRSASFPATGHWQAWLDSFAYQVPYSRESASTGFRRAAFRAGIKPNTIPIRLEQTKAATIEVVEYAIWKVPPAKWEINWLIARESSTPKIPPKIQTRTTSVRNCCKISL